MAAVTASRKAVSTGWGSLRWPTAATAMFIAVVALVGLWPLRTGLSSASSPLEKSRAADSVAVLVVAVVAVLGYSAVTLIAAYGAGAALDRRSRLDRHSRTVTLTRVRVQYRLIAREYLRVEVGGGQHWFPVYFQPSHLGMELADATISRAGPRRAVRTADDITLYPSGRARRKPPKGKQFQAPALRGDDLAERTRIVGSWRRRLAMDGVVAVAGLPLGVLWLVVHGGGPLDLLGGAIVGCAGAIWYTAIIGTDPS